MKIKMKVNGDSLEYDVHEQLHFDPEYVFDELGEQAGQMAWWYSLLAYKEQEAADFKNELARVEAQAELDIRNDTERLNKMYGKVTEAIIKAEVALHKGVIHAQTRFNELQKQAALLKAMTRGYENRGVLLATSASAQKAEVQARLRRLIGKASKESDQA